MKNQDNLQSKDPIEDFIKDWIKYKRGAVEGNDYLFYKMFLKEIYRTFVGLYAKLKSSETILLVDTVLKVATCELKVISIKYKKVKV